VLRWTVEEIGKLQRERVSGRELSDAQNYLAGHFPLTIETPNEIAAQVLNVVFFELPLQEIETFRERVQAVTPDDIQRVAREYLRPDRLSIVLVGNASSFVPQLRRLGFTDLEVIPIGQLDLMSASLRTETKKQAFGTLGTLGPGTPGTFGTLGPGTPGTFGTLGFHRPSYTAGQVNPGASNAPSDPSAIVKRIVDAKGGLAALKGVRTVVADATTTFRMEQGVLPSTTRTYVAYPDKYRVDATVAGAAVVQVFNAGTAWVKDPAGVHDAPAPMREDFAASVRRDIIPLLIAAAEGKLMVRALPGDATSTASFRVIEISGADLQPTKLYIDDHFLIAKQTFSAPGPEGRALEAEEVFSDYRTVNGVQVPFKAEVVRGGRVILDRVLTNVTLNSSLSDTLFARPQ
jgi:hypothetical protein